MQKGLLLLAAAACVAAEDFHSIAQRVNAAGKGWKAEAPNRFGTPEHAKQLCGTWLKGHPNYVALPEGNLTVRANLPTQFDARKQWPNCSVIAHVRDQSSCGSCWAFGSTETFEDRQCAQRGVDVLMSTEDTASCCHGLDCGFSMGCNGGQPTAALRWMTRQGVVTGGDYGGSKLCRPYTLPPCAHHVPASAKYPKCPSQEYNTPSCRKQCQPTSGLNYESNKHKGAQAYQISEVDKMMEALQKGPLSCAFQVYADFPTYKSGVYKHTTGSYLGGHAVEIVGYGTENGEDYWLVKNSWNEQWGDGGFFKILKGVNECGIEDSVAAIDF